jgi:hypothetical protein
MIAPDLPDAAPALSLAADLFSSQGKLPVMVVTLSDSGATIVSPKQPPCDSFAFLVRNGIKLPATIAWIDEGRLGLRFETALPNDRRQAAFRAPRGRRQRIAVVPPPEEALCAA